MQLDLSKLEQGIDDLVAEAMAGEAKDDVFRHVVEPIERLVIEAVLRRLNGNILKSSRVLNLSRMTIRKKLGR